MAGILCAVWNENAKYFALAETSGSLSCSGEIKKLPLFTARALWLYKRGQFGVFLGTDL